jgi:CysZ protein
MSLVFEILRRAAGDLFLPRVLSVLFLPMLVALVFWGALFWAFGDAWLAGLAALLAGVPLPDWMGAGAAAWLLGAGAIFLLGLLLLPAIYVTALLVTSLALMPLLVGVVAARHYPDLARRRGGSLAGSLANGLFALAVYVLAWLVTLPFWLLGPFGAAISVLLNAWLNQRLFLYDALSEHASGEELADLRGHGGWPLYLLAALLGLLHFVPLFNFLAPVYMGLAFAHYGLASLQQLRERPS